MDQTEIEIEEWESSLGNHELHFYLAGSDKYVCGFSPEQISKEVIDKFFRENNLKMVGYRKRNLLTKK